MKKLLIASAVAVGILASANVSAEFEGNIAVTNNYLWRGVTQTTDNAAISGGLDYSNESGFYAGTWASNIDWVGYNNYELDLYAGFGGDITSGVSYDVGVIGYYYPIGDTEADFAEIYGSVSFSGLSVGVAYEVFAEDDLDGDVYASLGYDMDLANDMGLSLVLGSYMFDDDSVTDYTHFGASVAKGDFSFGIEKNDLDGADGDPRVVTSWGMSF